MGVRAAHARLWDGVRAELERMQAAQEWARPVRVLVPSRALREQLSGVWVRRSGRALLGLRVQTLAAAASEILERASERVERADALVPLLAARELDRDPELVRALGDLPSRGTLVAGAVSDLLDAGLEDEHAEPALELLGTLDAPRDERARAEALVRVALRVRAQLHGLARARRGERFERAAACLEAHGEDVLPTRRLWIFGVADATGRVADFLEALLRAYDAQAIVSTPPDPFDGGVLTEYAQNLVERLGGGATGEPPEDEWTPPARVRARVAPGAHAEVRALADGIRTQLDAGVEPEAIGVVARTLEPYAVPLRIELARLGIPFSGAGARGPFEPSALRLMALCDLVRRGGECTVDRWLDALGFVPDLGSKRTPEPRRNLLRADLAVAAHALGAGRVRELAALDLDKRLGRRERLVLPIVQALTRDDSDPDGAARPDRRSVRRAQLVSARRHARMLIERFDAWRPVLPIEQHAIELRALCRDLGLGDAVFGIARLEDAIAGIEELPSDFELERAELADLLAGELRAAGRVPLGGAGGGVQILDVTEARGLCFEVLFLLGLNRDVFPRVVHDDPLLTEPIRVALLSVLPDLPRKRRGHSEEEHLFADLLSASPEITLSWQTTSDDAEARAPSPFLERYRLAHPELEFEPAREVLAPDDPGPRSLYEHALRARLHAPATEATEILGLALADARATSSSAALPVVEFALAGAREAILSVLDAPGDALSGLGPYLGDVGAIREQADPRRDPPPVTSLEGFARCPWQTFLRRLLQVEPIPDALDALPTLDPRWIGLATHAALETLVLRARPGRETQAGSGNALASSGCAGDVLGDSPEWPVVWPESPELTALIEAASERVLLDEGVALEGLSRALAQLVRPRVEAARSVVWPRDGQPLIVRGAEVRGRCRVEMGDDQEREIRFRADLVIRQGDRSRWIDFKTGRPFSRRKQSETRKRNFQDAVAQARALQALAYRLGGAEGSDGPCALREGAYVFLDPELDPAPATFLATPEDAALVAAFDRSAAILMRAWESGLFVPRIFKGRPGDSPAACQYCEVAEACRRLEPGVDVRLQAVLDRAEPPLADLWNLYQEPKS